MNHEKIQNQNFPLLTFRKSVYTVLILIVSLLTIPLATFAQDNGNLITIKGNVIDELNSTIISGLIFKVEV